MSRYTKEKLYELIPAVYRQRDAELGKPLEALLEVIAEQVNILEDDIEKLYNNWFIETCEEWVVPYIGDLVRARLLHSVGDVTSQRAWVANTIGYRRRKGTAPVLEQIARDITGWNARVVEFFQLLSTTQSINHLRFANTNTNLRDIERIELIDTPFDTIAHTVDVRNIRSKRGYYNIPNIGIFLWRLHAYPVNNAPAFSHGDGRFSFNQLGYDAPLFNNPVTETSITHIAEEINIPIPIRRLILKNRLSEYYGEGKSILIRVDDSEEPVAEDKIMVCNLSEWKHRPPSGMVAVDPILGRIAFPSGEEPEKVYVDYYYGFGADIGGGFYDRVFDIKKELGIVNEPEPTVIKISKDESKGDVTSISEAIEVWSKDPYTVFEIIDSENYTEPLELIEDDALPNDCILIIRAAENQRPVLRSMIRVEGGSNSILILDGLLIDQSIELMSDLALHITHCTLVPRDISIKSDSESDIMQITIKNTICGRVSIKGRRTLVLEDSIVGVGDDIYAVECYKASIERCTILGKTKVTLLELASNSIFTNMVSVKQRQKGCVRFSYIPEGSKIPRCYHCKSAKLRFISKRYDMPTYAQLDPDSEIFYSADNGAEMGAFNKLYQPQRIKNLEFSLGEYLRFGLEAGIFLIDAKEEIED